MMVKQNTDVSSGESLAKYQKSQMYPGIEAHPAGPILHTKRQKKK